jgi:hypothetical protein
MVERANVSGSADEVRDLYREAKKVVDGKQNQTRRDKQALQSLVTRGTELKEKPKVVEVEVVDQDDLGRTNADKEYLSERLTKEDLRGPGGVEKEQKEKNDAVNARIDAVRDGLQGIQKPVVEAKKRYTGNTKTEGEPPRKKMVCVETGEVVEVDARGVVWNGEWHSSKKTIKHGAWRKKREADPEKHEQRVDEDGELVNHKTGRAVVPAQHYDEYRVDSGAAKPEPAEEANEDGEITITSQGVVDEEVADLTPGNDDVDQTEEYDWGGE